MLIKLGGIGFLDSLTVRGLAFGRDFTTKLNYEAESSNLRKTVIGSRFPRLTQNRCYMPYN